MRFRLFRSRAFWFGVPGLVFLIWAWGLSKTHYSGVGNLDGPFSKKIGQLDGDVLLGWNPWPSSNSWRGFHERIPPGHAQEIKEFFKELGVPGVWVIFIPHRSLVTGYLLGWAGLVFWRSRKYRALPEGTGVE